MTALLIVLGVLLLLFLILLIRIRVFAEYGEELSLKVKVLFFTIPILPRPEKPKKKKKKPEKKPETPKEKTPEEEKKKKKTYFTKLKEKKGLSGLLSLLLSVARLALTTMKDVFKHLVIHRFDIGIALSSSDAASTAVNYGRLCSVVYPAVNIITAATVCKDYHVSIEPVFDDEKTTEFFAVVHAHIRPIFVLFAALKAAVKLLLIRLKL